MPLFDSVPREQYEDMKARALAAEERERTLLDRLAKLTDQVVTMRRRYAMDPKAEVRAPFVPEAKAATDHQIVAEAEAAFVERLTADLIRQGADPRAAKVEAQRIRRETASTTAHPGG